MTVSPSEYRLSQFPYNTIPDETKPQIDGNPVVQQPFNDTVAAQDLHRWDLLPGCSVEAITGQDIEGPDTDWSAHSSTLCTATAFCAGACLFAASFIFIWGLTTGSPLTGASDLGIALPMIFYVLYCVILCSLTIESAVPRKMHWLRRSFQAVNLGLFLTGLVFFGALIKSRAGFALIGVYIICSITHRVVGWMRRRKT